MNDLPDLLDLPVRTAARLLALACLQRAEAAETPAGLRAALRRLRYLLEPLRADVPPAAHAVDRLRALERRLEHERPSALAAERDQLLAALRALAEELEGWGGRGTEIERKYLLSALPPIPAGAAALEVEQGWLPGERLQERLRRVRSPEGERWYRTVKQGTGVRRVEIEEETTPELFAALWPLTRGRRVSKRRYRVREPGGLVWEVDHFPDRGLVLAEVELPSVATPVTLPGWLEPYHVREVTGEPDYLNVNLAR